MTNLDDEVYVGPDRFGRVKIRLAGVGEALVPPQNVRHYTARGWEVVPDEPEPVKKAAPKAAATKKEQ